MSPSAKPKSKQHHCPVCHRTPGTSGGYRFCKEHQSVCPLHDKAYVTATEQCPDCTIGNKHRLQREKKEADAAEQKRKDADKKKTF